MTDEQIIKIWQDYWLEKGKRSAVDYTRLILSAAIPEGCGVWREEECSDCKGTGVDPYEHKHGECVLCAGTGFEPVERVGE